jgi:hypothetical protein
MKFTIRDLLWLTAVAACLVGWYLERGGRILSSQRYVQTYEAKKRVDAELAAIRAEDVVARRALAERAWTHEEFRNDESSLDAFLPPFQGFKR